MPSTQPLIHVDHVSRDYRLGETVIRAVNDLSLEISSGEFLALLGSSGSGKSTLLNLMAGLDRPTSGAIHVQEKNLAALNSPGLARYRRETVGMVFQSFNLLPRMTLEENVELPLRLAEIDRSERSRRVAQGTNPTPPARNPRHARHDHHHGHPRASASRALRQPHRHPLRRQASRSFRHASRVPHMKRQRISSGHDFSRVPPQARKLSSRAKPRDLLFVGARFHPDTKS